jgi:hypothetical protein
MRIEETSVQTTLTAPTPRGAQSDEAHIGHIKGALGTIKHDDTGPRSNWRHRLMTFLAIQGPGLIVMVGDNDAGAVAVAAGIGRYVGHTAGLFFALALLDASVNGAMAVSLSTAYAGDALSLRHALHRKPEDAKAFYAVYGGLQFGGTISLSQAGSCCCGWSNFLSVVGDGSMCMSRHTPPAFLARRQGDSGPPLALCRRLQGLFAAFADPETWLRAGIIVSLRHRGIASPFELPSLRAPRQRVRARPGGLRAKRRGA